MDERCVLVAFEESRHFPRGQERVHPLNERRTQGLVSDRSRQLHVGLWGFKGSVFLVVLLLPQLPALDSSKMKVIFSPFTPAPRFLQTGSCQLVPKPRGSFLSA